MRRLIVATVLAVVLTGCGTFGRQYTPIAELPDDLRGDAFQVLCINAVGDVSASIGPAGADVSGNAQAFRVVGKVPPGTRKLSCDGLEMEQPGKPESPGAAPP